MTRCIIFILVFIHSSIFSQPTFVHKLGNSGGDLGYSCSPAIGGGSVVAVAKGIDTHARIVFVDSTGYMTGYKNILVDNYCTPSTVLQAGNDGYVLLMQISDSSYSSNNYRNSLALYFTNLSGDYRDDKQYSFSKNDIPLNLVHRNAGGYICFSGGVNSSGDVITVVTVFDDNGNVIWSNQYIAPFGLPGVKGIEMPDSNICFIASLPDPSAPYYLKDIAVIMLDPNGTVQWSRVYRTTYDDLPFAIVGNDSSEIFITGRSAFIGRGPDCFLLRLDRNGNLLHSRVFDAGTNIGETPRCIIAANDGSAVLLGEMGSVNGRDIFLLNVDSNATLLSAYSYNFSSTYNYGWDMYRTRDGGIFFTGSLSPPYAIIVKTEADGNLNCFIGSPQITEYDDFYQDTITLVTNSPSNVVIRNYPVGAPFSSISDYVICALSTGFNLQFTSDGIAPSTYPNPTTGDLTISFPRQSPIVNVTITDALGQEVSRASYNNTSKFSLELKGGSGLYFIKVLEGERCWSYRVVKM